jgi:hypothetical protein
MMLQTLWMQEMLLTGLIVLHVGSANGFLQGAGRMYKLGMWLEDGCLLGCSTM